MPPDIVQIGPLVISKSLLDVVSPLVGTLIGGLITYLATIAVENRKWRREKKDKLQEQKREAFACALEWITPIDIALNRASMLISSYQWQRIDKNKFLRDFPDLISSLPPDLPAHLRIFLEDAYPKSLEIVRGFDDLKFTALMRRETIADTETFIEAIEQCNELISDLHTKLDSLSNYLREEYFKTFS